MTSDTIANIETIHISVPSRYGGPPPGGVAQWPHVQMLLVKVTTQAGLTGWGEAFGHSACATTKLALDTLVAPLCLGAAIDPEPLQARLLRALHVYGPSGPVLFALSGIDIALWDIRGKAKNLPVRHLLGNAGRAAVPAYASLLRYDDPALAGRAVADAVDRGFQTVKLHEALPEAVVAARATVGFEISLMLDVNCRWTPDEAAAMALALRPHRLNWIEEPCWPADPATLARIGEVTPIAAGENAGTLDTFEQLAGVGRVAFLQPSATKLGGLTGMIRGADIARSFGARLAPHSAYFGPGLAATIQFCAAHDLSCEWYDCQLAADICGLTPKAGRFILNDAPGLGIAIDEEAIARFTIG